MQGKSRVAHQVVVFLGPDGAGKSTILAQVAAALTAHGTTPKQFYFAPGFLPRYRSKGDNVITTNPHEGRQYGPILVAAKIALMLFEFRFGLRKVRKSDEIIIFDRFIHDLLVDPRRYRMGHLRWWMRGMLALAPCPDLLVVITAPAQVIQARKQEVPYAETARQVAAYQQLAGQFANHCIVENTGTPQDAARKITARIITP